MVTTVKSGANSATLNITSVEDRLTMQSWVSLPKGKLKKLLARQYLTPSGEPDRNGFMRAYATAGATVYCSAAYVVAEIDLAEVDSEYPVGSPIVFVRELISPAYIRLAVSYSASE